MIMLWCDQNVSWMNNKTLKKTKNTSFQPTTLVTMSECMSISCALFIRTAEN